tara:strand:- start:6239 stop:7537 length:1299 start_codon:yes stop_codon:yes gene_type:complete
MKKDTNDPTEATEVESTAGKLQYLQPGQANWRALAVDESLKLEGDALKEEENRVSESRRRLKENLHGSLQMPNLLSLAGSGTSLGPEMQAPSMWDLWDYAIYQNPGTKRETGYTPTEAACNIFATVGFDPEKQDENIEALLSQCDAFLQFKEDKAVQKFVDACKKIVLEKCSIFLRDPKTGEWQDEKLDAHRTFLRRLSKRRVRDPRLKLFTTNYDLCFERSASLQDLIILDGFSFFQPRQFSPSYFDYDIVRRTPSQGDIGDYLPGAFKLLKLHGSVSWERTQRDEVTETLNPASAKACLIYPAKGKYQQSFLQPHLELISQYLNALRQPNTCLLIAGFGFNDDHLSEPILAAIKTNPQLRVIISDWKCEEQIRQSPKGASRYWKEFAELAKNGHDIWFINASFADFSNLLPDLSAMSPAEQLEKVIKRMK